MDTLLHHPRARTVSLGVALFVPTLAVAELIAMVAQPGPVLSPDDLDEAARVVAATAKSGDALVGTPPRYGLQLVAAASPRDAGVASFVDPTRFPRVVEVAVRGEHAGELEGWTLAQESPAGSLSVRVWTNPVQVSAGVNLSLWLEPAKAAVSVRTSERSETSCPWVATGATDLPRGAGLASTPARRFSCGHDPADFVGRVLAVDAAGTARWCLWFRPAAQPVRLRLRDVPAFGVVRIMAAVPDDAEGAARSSFTVTVQDGSRAVGAIDIAGAAVFAVHELALEEAHAPDRELSIEVAQLAKVTVPLCLEANVR